MRIFRMFCAKYVDGPRKELFEGPNPMLTMQEQPFYTADTFGLRTWQGLWAWAALRG